MHNRRLVFLLRRAGVPEGVIVIQKLALEIPSGVELQPVVPEDDIQRILIDEFKTMAGRGELILMACSI